MTNKERLISLLGFAPPVNSAEAAMIDQGIVPSDVYTLSVSVPIKMAAIYIMEVLLTTADTGDATSGFQIKYDRGAVLKRINLLKGELGLIDDSYPTITSKSVW